MSGLEYCLGVKEAEKKRLIISTFSKLNCKAVGDAPDCARFLRLLRKVQPQLTVLDLFLPGNVRETATIIDREGLAALLLVSEKPYQRNLVAGGSASYTVLPLPLQVPFVETVLEVIWQEFRRRRELLHEIRDLKSKLQSRKVTERAKDILMSRLSISEPEAYRYLQKESMNLRLPMVKVAQSVIQKAYQNHNSNSDIFF